MVMERPVVIRAQHLVEVDVDEPISRDHPPATHVGVLLATNDEVRRTAINNARMQNPQNALDHPLSSLSIQWQERHDRLPPRVVDQLEFSPRGDRKSTRLNSSH